MPAASGMWGLGKYASSSPAVNVGFTRSCRICRCKLSGLFRPRSDGMRQDTMRRKTLVAVWTIVLTSTVVGFRLRAQPATPQLPPTIVLPYAPADPFFGAADPPAYQISPDVIPREPVVSGSILVEGMGPFQTPVTVTPVECSQEPCAADSEDKCCHGVCRDPGCPSKPKIERPGDRKRTDCPPYRYQMDGCRRAGNPQVVAPWAACSTSHKYSGWFVGGGAAVCGRPRRREEGTWGVDYDGWLSPRHVFMRWTCGREQGGEGAYETDGEPEVVARVKHHVEHAMECKRQQMKCDAVKF